jgi:hypothetical protein
MKRFHLAAFVIALFLSAPLHAGDALQTDRLAVNAGETVTLTGPAILLERIKSCQQGWGSNGYTINWGDGRGSDPQSRNCLSEIRHAYTVPGSYTVYAAVYHWGPTDMPVDEWTGKTTLTVSGKAGALGLELLEPKGGETFYYQDYPKIRFSVVTGQKLDLGFELLGADGSVSASGEVKSVSYNGEGSAYLGVHMMGEAESYAQLLRTSKNSFTLRVTAKDEAGKVLLQKESKPFTMLAELARNFPNPFRTKPASGRSITADYSFYHPDCSSYELDWGDGSPPERLEQPLQKQCRLNSTQRNWTHTYKAPGTYRVVFRTTDIEPFTKLDQLVPYYATDAVIE